MIGKNDIFAPFVGHEGVIVSFIKLMRERGLSPTDVLQAYDAHVAEMLATMQPPPPDETAPAPETRRVGDQPDAEHRLGACPKCGADVWGIKKCPHVAPPWRTFFACDGETCAYHGRSRLTVDVLRRQWPAGAESED